MFKRFIPPTLIIAGSGRHASVVIDAARLECPERTLELVDQPYEGQLIAGLIVRADLPETEWAHVAIGSNPIRQKNGQALEKQGKRLCSVIHPNAIIARAANMSEGCFIAANAIIGPNATVGKGCIINHGAVIDHDCWIGAWTHIAANVTLCGTVRIGERCLIGAGAVILPDVSVGDDAIVGAGAVVTRHVLPNQTVMGVPAIPRVFQGKNI